MMILGAGMIIKKLYNARRDLTETRNNTRSLNSSLENIIDRPEKLTGVKAVQKACRNAVNDEFRRRDIWEKEKAETKRLAAGRPIWVIKCPTQEMWLKRDIPFKNDYGYCLTLKKYLESEGLCAVIQTYEDWYCDAGADVELLMGSLHDYHPDRRVSGRINVMWLVCHPERAPEEVLDRYDLVLADSGLLADSVKGRTMARVEPFIVTADTDLFYRDRSPVIYDRVFIGNTRGINRDCVKWCSENKIELDVWGGGWEKYYKDDPYIHLHGYVSYEDTADIYRRARIIINDHHPEMRKTGMINNRCCEVLLCGRTMLCDWSQGVEDEFGDLMTYYHDETDFIEALKRAESDHERLCSEIDRRYEELVDKYSHASGIRRLISVVDSARE